jgi:hypothetical protein
VTRAFVLLGSVALLAGCGSGSKSAETTTGATTLMTTNPAGTSAGSFHYPATVTKNYMRSCIASPKTTRAYCSCTLDELAKSVSTKDFERIGLAGGQIPPRIRSLILRAARDCRDKL